MIILPVAKSSGVSSEHANESPSPLSALSATDRTPLVGMSSGTGRATVVSDAVSGRVQRATEIKS
jgi:hypothetical protein